MNFWKKFVVLTVVLLLSFLCLASHVSAKNTKNSEVTEAYASYRMNELELYAKSAVLMDGENGRILYGKDALDFLPNASTTKILTCLLALECCSPDEVVTVSEYAASMPRVKLGCEKGEQFYLKDLLYSLMLESHNDTAVAIAEQIDGSVEDFSTHMNARARELGCENSNFVTPNGLDGENAFGPHGTTAYDLGRIMMACIQNSLFLEITRTPSITISNLDGSRSYALYNHNAFLQMNPDALSGKTGFTAKAGYCYVGACRTQDRTYTYAVLACGWPNNKSYKWSDVKKLISFGNQNYQKKTISIPSEPHLIPLREAVLRDGRSITYPTQIEAVPNEYEVECLVSEEDQIRFREELPKELLAGEAREGACGKIRILLNEVPVGETAVHIHDQTEHFDFSWCVRYLFHDYFQANH